MDIKTIDINKLSNYIRQINGDNRMGAGTLAEKIVQYLHEQSPEVEPAIQVKPLEWVVCGDELHALKKNYKIREVHDRHSLYFRGGLFGRYPSLDEAKEAAQKDYDSKILSCLSVTAKPAPVECEPLIDLMDNEQYRIQMAAISTAAIGYWEECDPILPEYDTVALRDVAKLYQKYDALFKKQIDEETRRMVLELCDFADTPHVRSFNSMKLAKQLRERMGKHE